MKTEEAKELPLVGEGDYTAKVSRVLTDQSGRYGNMVILYFDIDGTDVPALASQKLNSATKLHGWAGILLGKQLDVGEQLVFKDLEGKAALVTVRNRVLKNEDGAAQTRDGKTVMTSNVTEIRKPK